MERITVFHNSVIISEKPSVFRVAKTNQATSPLFDAVQKGLKTVKVWAQGSHMLSFEQCKDRGDLVSFESSATDGNMKLESNFDPNDKTIKSAKFMYADFTVEKGGQDAVGKVYVHFSISR